MGSASISVQIVSADVPTVTITAPANNHKVTVGTSVTFTGTASDTVDGTISGSLNWYSSRDGSIQSNSASFSTTSLSTGTHTITANVTDTDGNVGSSTVSVTILADTVPTVTITAPANNHQATLGSSVTFTGTASDTLDGTISDSLDWYSSIDGSIANDTTSIITNSLSTGTHTITANVTDTDGNVGSSTVSVTILADTAPTVTITAPANNHQATVGTSVTFTGNATDTLDGTISGSLNWYSSRDGSIANNTASFSTTSLSTGTHTITANVTDTDGNVGSSTISVQIVSANVPTVTITAPANNHQATVGTSVTFTGTASDTLDGTISGSLNWYSSRDGSIANNTASFSTTSLSTGTHTITANVTDTDGNTGSNSVSVTILANTGPTMNIVRPSDGSSFTEGTNIRFSIIARDTLDGGLGPNTDWYSSIDGLINMDGGNFYIDTLSIGTHTITANVTDTDGNVGSASISVTILADVAPTVTITAPADNSQVTVGSSVTFTGTASDTLDGTISGSLNWYSSRDGSIANNTSSFNTTSLSTGTHTITANVTDTDGNVGSSTISVQIVSADVPTVTITAPANNHKVTVGTSVTFTGTASDTLDGTISGSLDWYSSRDGSIQSNSASFSTTSLSTGTHTITANVTDTDGNVGSASISVTILADVAPTVTITAPANNHQATVGSSVTFTGTASDTLDGTISGSLDWYSSRDGSIQSNSASFSTTSLSTGTHTITANVTDTDGNVGSSTVSVTILADTAPTVTITAPADNHKATLGTSVTFTGTASDTLDGTISGSLNWYSSRDGSIANNTASFSTTSLSTGTHTITANVTDTDGNVGSSTISVTILADTAPTITITAPVDGYQIMGDELVRFTGTATDSTDGDISNSINWYSSIDGSIANNTAYTVTGLLSAGTHTITANVTDSDGNTDTTSRTLVVVAAGITVNIVSPQTNGATLTEATDILFNGTARDALSRDLSDTIDWEFDTNGMLRTDISNFVDSSLSLGNHTVMASATSKNLLADGLTILSHGTDTLSLLDGGRFGASVTVIGDIDGNGVQDLAVGADLDGTGGHNRGAVYVLLMEQDRTIKDTTKITHGTGGISLDDGDQFGYSVAAIGDMNSDGIPDIAVGAINDDTGGRDRGAVYVITLNADGTVNSASTIAHGSGGLLLDNGDSFGFSISAIGDINADSIQDLAVGAFLDDTGGFNIGAVHLLFMNADGTVNSTSTIAHGTGGLSLSAYDYFGSVTAIGDIDGDGTDDLAAGAYRNDAGGNDTGAVYILFMGTNGTVNSVKKLTNDTDSLSLSAGDWFGRTVAGAGDIDGNGVPDLIVGTMGDDTGGQGANNRGAIHVLLLNHEGGINAVYRISSTLQWLLLDSMDHFGSAVTIGDIDGDGTPDLVIGAYRDDTGGPDRGTVYVLYGINVHRGTDARSITILVDTVPTVTITAPTDGHSITSGTSVTFTGTASDTLDGTISGSLDWYSSRDGSIQSNSASFNTTSLSTGTHTITANVTDTDGNVGSASISVQIVSADVPTVTITAPANNHKVTVGTSVTFTGTASDTVDGTISGSLNWYSSRDGSIQSNSASFSTTSLSTGTHTITANVTDTDGNVGSSTVSVTILADTVPTVTITAPANNHQATLGSSVTFTGTASDTLDGTISDSLDWYSSIDGSIANDTTSIITNSLSTGTHTITANVTDTDGNVGSSTVSVTILADTAPTVTITAPADNSQVTVGSSVTFTGNATDTLDGTISGSLNWYSSRDGSIANNTASFSTTSLSTGTHTITANVTDTDGNVGSSTISVQIVSANVPTVTITAPANNHQATVGTSVTFTGTASDTLDGTISGSLNWYSSRDGSIANNTASFSTTSLSTGTHTITANVTDTDGNTGSNSVSVTILANTGPTMNIVRPSDGSSFTEGTNIRFSIIARDTLDGGLGPNTDWYSSIDGLINMDGGNFYIDTLSIGTHTITANVTDTDGNVGSASISVTILADVAPTVTITAPADNSQVTDDPTVTLWLFAGAVMVTVGAVSASIVTDTVDEPTLPSVSVTFAVIVCVPVDNEFVMIEVVSFAIEPSMLEYQSRESDIVPSSVSEAVPVNVTDDPSVA